MNKLGGKKRETVVLLPHQKSQITSITFSPVRTMEELAVLPFDANIRDTKNTSMYRGHEET